MRIANPSRRFDYVLEADRGSAEPTVFLLRRLNREALTKSTLGVPLGVSQIRALDELTEAARREKRELTAEELNSLEAAIPDWRSKVPAITQMHADICHQGIEAIRGLVDEDGKSLTMKPADFIRWAPAEIVQELGGEILRLSSLSEGERKNSPAPPGPQA